MTTPSFPPSTSKKISRVEFLALLDCADRVKANRFCRQAALAWLASYPGDLVVNYYLARSLVEEKRISQASVILENICQVDPEYEDPQSLLNQLQHDHIEDGGTPTDITANHPEEAKNRTRAHSYLEVSQKALQLNRLEEAEVFAQKAYIANSDDPLTAINHLKVVRGKNDFQSTQNLANLYHQKWPNCIHFSLYLAEALLQQGNDTDSVILLHQCTSKDTSGQVAERIWGADHPYKDLWPGNLFIHFNVPVPADVGAAMGWNLLDKPGSAAVSAVNGTSSTTSPTAVDASSQMPVGETNTTTTASPSLSGQTSSAHRPEHNSAIQKELDRLARKVKDPAISRSDGRFPVYVIFSHLGKLQELYGTQTAAMIDGMIKELAALIRQRPGWGSLVYYPDDPTGMSALELSPVSSNDPWKLKLSLSDLDQALTKKGSMIGAVLIVGNTQIIPFHQLPNPTDDSDAHVLSDNPYATLDSNYFIPEWPVGRLPGETGSDAGLLLELLRQVIKYHGRLNKSKGWQKTSIIRRVGLQLANWLKPERRPKPSLGYTAQVWQASSKSVFQPIQRGQTLLASPPVRSGSLPGKKSLSAQFAYFNLHGISDGVEWFGQKSYASITSEPDYPVALSLQDFHASHLSPHVVFSEACFGALIDEKDMSQALSLKFIASGTRAFVGSTGIAYGSVTSPLIAADLLGNHFWNFIKKDMPVGFALLRAKLALVKDMHKRQNYLDGEDQKTLISFILLGDPLMGITAVDAGEKGYGRLRSHPDVKLVTEQHAGTGNFILPSESLIQVKKIVDRYLPGLADAEFNISKLSIPDTLSDHGPGGKKSNPRKDPVRQGQRFVVTMKKSIEIARQVHGYYARFTIDERGKVHKLATSR